MRKLNLILAALAALVILGCGDKASTEGGGTTGTTGASAQADPNKTWDLKVNVQKGDKWDYDMTMTMNADVSAVIAKTPAAKEQLEKDGTDHSLTLNVVQHSEVTDAADGKFTISNTYSDVKADAKGMFKQFPGATEGPKPETFTLDSRGLKVGGGSEDPGSMNPALPEKAVKIGDTWDATPAGSTNKVEGKLIGTDTINGTELLKVEYTGFKNAGMETDGPVTFWIDPKTGAPYKLEAKIKANQNDVVMTGTLSKVRKS